MKKQETKSPAVPRIAERIAWQHALLWGRPS